ncbi:MAG TPA: HAD-IA family hydrolase [Rhodanobacteraceae bacterium]|jgi:HAD superfamily hydrolase (TIGR01509 family)|nr:HAD-IA family hydrolase [Rhodanobacteraceae bacterium]
MDRSSTAQAPPSLVRSPDTRVAPIEAVIFDCDGTLVDSEVLANTVLVEYAAEFGLRMPVAEALRRYVGGRMADCVADLERRLGRRLPASFTPQLRERIAAAFRSSLKPVAGAREMLASLRLPFCVASSGPPDKIRLSLEVTRLLPFFTPDRIFSAYDIGFWKPDPRLFLHAAQSLGVAPKNCAVVEDSVPGIRAGLAAGMPTFWFRAPAGFTEPVTALARLADLPGILAQPAGSG